MHVIKLTLEFLLYLVYFSNSYQVIDLLKFLALAKSLLLL